MVWVEPEMAVARRVGGLQAEAVATEPVVTGLGENHHPRVVLTAREVRLHVRVTVWTCSSIARSSSASPGPPN